MMKKMIFAAIIKKQFFLSLDIDQANEERREKKDDLLAENHEEKANKKTTTTEMKEELTRFERESCVRFYFSIIPVLLDRLTM